MKEHNVTQGESDWILARLGKVTASELGQIVTTDFAIRTGEMPKTYLAKKIAEAWRKQPLPSFSTRATEDGQLLEDEARRDFAFHTEHKITNVGFVETDDGFFGASPDALLDTQGGLELKCPNAETHVKYLLSGKAPSEYLPQIHGGMYACERSWWVFQSYRRGFPTFKITVQRDESIMAKIDAALAAFKAQFDAGMQTLRNAQ